MQCRGADTTSRSNVVIGDEPPSEVGLTVPRNCNDRGDEGYAAMTVMRLVDVPKG